MSEVQLTEQVPNIKPERVWIRVSNCEKQGRFIVVLEINGGPLNGGYEKEIYNSVDECDGNISQSTNITSYVVMTQPEQSQSEGHR